MEDIRQF